MKSRIIAVVAGKFFFNTIRSGTIVNSWEECEVEGNCCCSGQVFFNTIRSGAFVSSLEDCEVEDNCCCSGQVFLIPFALGHL